MLIVCLHLKVEHSAKTLNPIKYQNCCNSLQYNANFFVWIWKNTIILNKCFIKLMEHWPGRNLLVLLHHCLPTVLCLDSRWLRFTWFMGQYHLSYLLGFSTAIGRLRLHLAALICLCLKGLETVLPVFTVKISALVPAIPVKLNEMTRNFQFN